MSNYNSLKATINANIKTNGNQEITGSVLNSVLTAMVNSLGADYLFAGYATPAINPGTPDQNVAYLAATPGTYTNFGGLVLDDGDVAFLLYNGSWTKQAVDIPNRVLYLALLSRVDASCGNQRGLLNEEIVTGKYRVTTGTLSTMNGYFYSTPIHLYKGDSVIITGVNVVTSVAIISEVDASNNWVGLLVAGTGSSLSTTFVADREMYIGISATTSQVSKFTLDFKGDNYRLSQEIEKNQEEMNRLLESTQFPVDNDLVNVGKYRVTTGNLANGSSYFYTNPIKLHKGDKVIVTDANVVTSVAIISEVNENNAFVSVLYAGQGESASFTYTAPRDMYVGLSAPNSQKSKLTLESKGIFERLTEDENAISGLNTQLTDTTRGVSESEVTTGKYRNVSGALSTLTGYFYSNPIRLHKGDRIATDTAIPTIAAVSYITKVDENNNFISVLYPGDGETKVIDYTLTEDCYIGISATNSRRGNFVIYQKGIESRIDGLVDDVVKVSPDPQTKLPAITNNPLSTIRRDAGYGSIIRKWGIIGDSLSSGEMQCFGETPQSSSDYKFLDMYQYSTGQVFARLIGASAYNFSNGGQTTWGWLKNQGTIHDDTYIGGVGGGDWSLAQQAEYLQHGYIIAMGVNDRTKIQNGDYILGSTDEILTYDGTNSDIDDTTT